MDATRFDALAVTRAVTNGRSRRGLAGGLLLGASALLGWPVATSRAAPAGKPLRRCQNRLKRTRTQLNRCRVQLNQCRVQLRPHLCAGKNWCIDRNQTCGPAAGFGRCLVLAGGGNTCAEILFQAATCADCAPNVCANCQCVLAAGGGDRCNNGAMSPNDFICVRPV